MNVFMTDLTSMQAAVAELKTDKNNWESVMEARAEVFSSMTGSVKQSSICTRKHNDGIV